MAQVPVILRLYRMHDLDLITFVEMHKLDFVKAAYCALKAFSKGEYFIIDVPPLRNKGERLDLKRVYTKILYLDEEEDAGAIELLFKVKDGNKNNFLKNLLRIYLCNPLSEAFFENEEDAKLFFNKFDVFKVGKRITDAGSEVKLRKSGRKTIGSNKVTEKREVKKNQTTIGHKDNENDDTEAIKSIEDITEQNVEDVTDMNVADIADMFSSIIG